MIARFSSWPVITIIKLAVAVTIFCVAGAVLLMTVFAGTPTASLETENGTVSSTADKITDSTASDGLAVIFGTSTAFQANCIVSPHVCGYPDETNTGVPAGTTLINVPADATSGAGWTWRSDTQQMIITDDDVTISGYNITGSIHVSGDNVTIEDTRITSGDYYPVRWDGDAGLIVKDSEIIGTSSDVTSCISFDDYTALRVDCSGSADGFKTDSNVTIKDSYVHGLAVGESTHNDGAQTTGGSNVTIDHNTFKLGDQDGINSCLEIGNEGGTNSDWLIEDNLFDGGGWSINASSDPADNLNFQVLNNRFTRRAGYGPGTIGGATWTGNYYDDDGSVVD